MPLLGSGTLQLLTKDYSPLHFPFRIVIPCPRSKTTRGSRAFNAFSRVATILSNLKGIATIDALDVQVVFTATKQSVTVAVTGDENFSSKPDLLDLLLVPGAKTLTSGANAMGVQSLTFQSNEAVSYQIHGMNLTAKPAIFAFHVANSGDADMALVISFNLIMTGMVLNAYTESF